MHPPFYQATLSSAWCTASSESKWLGVKNKLGHFLVLPFPTYVKLFIIMLGLVVGVLVLWGVARFVMQRGFKRSLPLRWLIRLEVGALVLSLALLSPWGVGLANRGLVALLPPDAGGLTDAIVVLGRGPGLQNQRVSAAVALWQAQRAPLIFASGVGDAEDALAKLRVQGIPESALDGEGCSLTTEENARFTAAMLKPRGVQHILLVTDPPHMLRSLLTFQSFGFQVTPYPASLPTLTRQQKTFMVFSEYGGLMNYGLRGRFFSRETEVITARM
jgi:uncharacterized SAM-binding protein YcdF (DUF218 family)